MIGVPDAVVNGIELYYERRGAGPRLLFFNGSGASLAGSAPFIDPFAERFEVLVHDQRGLGRSSVPPGPYTMADYAADAAALLDHVGWERCAVVGISFGGMVAQEFAVTWPQRVARLALLCTSAGGAGGSSYPLDELASLAPDERAAVSRRILDTRFDEEWLAAHPSDAALAEAMAARRAGDLTPEEARGQSEQLGARRHHDVYDRLGAITCPTLVASGRYDGIAPLTNGAAIAARIDGAELAVYEGGHVFFVQDRRALGDVVSWLAEDPR